MADHKDDDTEPLTDEWMDKALTDVIIDRDTCLRGFHNDCGDLRLDIVWCTHNKTRGEFRQLCRAMGMTLKEQL